MSTVEANALLVESSSPTSFEVESVWSLAAEHGQAFAISACVQAGVGMRVAPELVCFDSTGREIPIGSTLASGGQQTTRPQKMRRVFPVQPGTASVRARLRARADRRAVFRVTDVDLCSVQADPYQTGALVRLPDPYLRNGVVLESHHGIVNQERISSEDVDGDGKWAVVDCDLDELTTPVEEGWDWRSRFEFPPNEMLWSDGVVLKSDTVLQDRKPDLDRALHFRMSVHEGPYDVMLSDPGRAVSVSTDGTTWTRYEGGAEIGLGQLTLADGVVELRVDACYRDRVSVGPVYFDYVRLVPVSWSSNVARLLAAGRKPAQLTRGTADERSVDVAVDAPAFRHGANWPVRCGLPLPRGELSAAGNVAVLDVEGNAVPAQARAMATWPDGSVKWLHLDFQHDLSHAGEGRYTVAYGNRALPGPNPDDPVRIRTTAAGVEVDTGVLRFLVPKARFGLVENVCRRDGTVVQREGLTTELVEADGMVWNVGELPVEKIEVEQAGPLHAVIMVATRPPESGRPSRGFYHRARIHAYAGSPLVQVDYFVANADSRPAGEVEGSMSSTVLVRSLAVTLKPAAAVTRVTHALGRSGAPGAAIQKTEDTVVHEDHEFNAQLSGWLAARLDDAGVVGVGVEAFREQFPKALRWGPDRLEIALWADEGGNFEWIEGVGKTHRLSFYYGPSDSEDVADGTLLAHGPVLATADPQWYMDSGAFGRQVSAAASGLPEVERTLADHIAGPVVAGAGLGFENYGDHNSSGYVKDSYLWDNNEYDLPAGCLVHFVRTGDREALRIGLASALHYLDVDTIHYSSQHPEWLGSAHVHSHDTFGHHTAGGPNFAHAGYVQGLIWYSYFTGEPVGVQGAQGIADWVLRAWPPRLGMERNLGHPLITLMDVYEATGDEKYLQGAARCVDLALRWEHPERSGWLACIAESPAYYSGSPFCNGLLTTGLIKFNALARLPEVDELLERIARWTLTDVWRPPGAIQHKGGSPRKPGKAYFINSHGNLMAHAYERTHDPLYLVVPRALIIQAFGRPQEVKSGARDATPAFTHGTRDTGLVFNYMPSFLDMLAAHGNPQPDAELGLTVDPTEVDTPRGTSMRMTVALHNTGSDPVHNVRLSLQPRLDFTATPISPVPEELPPEQGAVATFDLSAPARLNLTCEYNRIAYAHVSVIHDRGGTRHVTHAFVKVAVLGQSPP